VGDANADAQQDLNRVLRDLNERYTQDEKDRKRENEEIINAQNSVVREIEEIKSMYEQNKKAVVKMIMD
jgi:hypothetical protein